MKTTDLQAIAETLVRIVTPDMTPKQLLKAAGKKHPRASKKDVVRAAFYAIISSAATEPEKAQKLHGFAIGERASNSGAHP